MTNLWSGRFDIAPDAAAFEFGASFRFDRRLFEDDVIGSRAWARALARAGILQAGGAQGLDGALGARVEPAGSASQVVRGARGEVPRLVGRPPGQTSGAP